jgi:hypothetical protein
MHVYGTVHKAYVLACITSLCVPVLESLCEYAEAYSSTVGKYEHAIPNAHQYMHVCVCVHIYIYIHIHIHIYIHVYIHERLRVCIRM